MNFSFFNQAVAIDLGTANTVIFMDDKKVLDEPSIIATDRLSGKVVAIGKKAKEMHEKESPNIRTIRPLKDGVIADFDAAENMIREFIKMANPKRSIFSPSYRMVVCIPSGSTEVEKRAVRDAAEHSGAREFQMIYEPMAAALGIGLNVTAPSGNMIVDIGGGTTEIAVISLGGIVADESIKTAGDTFTAEIQQYLRQQYNIRVGEISAELVKLEVGSAMSNLEDAPDPYAIIAPNVMTVHPVEANISYQEIAHCLDKSISKIENSILSVLEQTPPELYGDIVKKGIFLTGGGAMLRGLAQRLTRKVNIEFHVAEDPLRAVARGTGVALKNPSYPFLMR
ncbi:MAG: rod shape-determining protein [Bacteroidales bacterium]|nr:rod shape-determining protein [Candidatus Cacconaster equifaecalis]